MASDEKDDHNPDYGLHHLTPGTLLNNGQYKVLRSIGEGGFGITYEARDNLDRQVAIKECFPSQSAHRSRGSSVRPTSARKEEDFNTAKRNFLREARVLAKVDHPNVVRVQTFFEENDTAYMAMDFINGKNLDDVIADDPARLTPSYVFRLCHDLLTALDYLHETRILHRDIKPSNVRIDRWGTPILIDFGTAKQITSSETAQKTTREVVTDGYSPPEFYERGERQNDSSDLYSLAATLHHMITGTVPPAAQQRTRRMWEHKGDPYTPLAGRFLMHERSMLTLIDRGMALKIDERPVDAKTWLRTMPDMDTMSYHPQTDERPPEIRRWPDRVGGLLAGAAAAALAIFVVSANPSVTGTGFSALGLASPATQNDASAERVAALLEEIAALQSTVERAETDVTRLRSELDDVTAERDAALAAAVEDPEASEQLAALRAEFDALTSESRARADRIRALLSRVREGEADRDGALSDLAQARAALEVAERRNADIEQLLVATFGGIPSPQDLNLVLDSAEFGPDLLVAADRQRAFLDAFEATIENQDTRALEVFLDEASAPALQNAAHALVGNSVDNPEYTRLARGIQTVLLREGCGVEDVDGIFGVSSEAAYTALRAQLGDQCGLLPSLPRVLSSDPIYSEWLATAADAQDRLGQCHTLLNATVCRAAPPARTCATEGGCLHGGIFQMSQSDFCARYDAVRQAEWADHFMRPDDIGSLRVVVATLIEDRSAAFAEREIARYRQRLPSLPFVLGRSQVDDGDPVYVIQLARGLSDINQAHEIALYANFCTVPGAGARVSPLRDAIVIRRGEGTMHLTSRVVEAIGQTTDSLFGSP